MRSWTKLLGLSFLTALLALGLFFCSKKEPIRIGFIGGLTGRVADLGTAGRNGATLAVEEQNLRGKIRGSKIRLIVADDRQNPEFAVDAIKTLLAQNVEAIIGPMTSTMAVEISPYANKAATLLISPTANTEDLAGIDDYFFRVISSTHTYADHLANYLRNEKELSRISVIYDLNNRAFTESFYSGFESALKKLGGEVTRTTTFHSGPDISFFELTQEAIGPETEGVLILANALDAALICQQIDKISPEMPIAGTGWSATEKLIEIGGKAVEGIYLQQFFDREDTGDRYTAFRKAYFERFGEEPGFASATSYDAANLIINALKRTPESLSIKQAIIDIGRFEGVQQPIVIDRFGDANRTPYISTVRDGKFVVSH